MWKFVLDILKNNIYRNMVIGLMLFAYSSMIFCGCSSKEEAIQKVVPETKEVKSVEASYENTVSENDYNCIVDTKGYLNAEEKKVFFKDIDDGVLFWIVEKETLRAVYEGSVNELMDSPFDGVGDFSEVSVSGNYYVYTKEYGESKEFVINDNINKDVASSIYMDFSKAALDNDFNIKPLLFAVMAYDLNRDEKDLLESISGSVDNYLSLEEIDDDDGILLGTLFAEFSCVGQKYYYETSKKSLIAAEKIYEACKDNERLTDSEEWYAFNTWMLRATGEDEYKDVVEVYIEEHERENTAIRFIGDYGYLTATKNVKPSIGYTLITPIMDEAAVIVADTKLSSCLSIIDEDDMEKTLLDVVKLTYVNYVITNQEYRKAIRDNLHYLFGRNPEGIDYLENKDSCLWGDDGLYYKSMILFVLSNVDFVLETGEDLP